MSLQTRVVHLKTKMYVDNGSCNFDPNDAPEAAAASEDGFNSQLPPPLLPLPSMNDFSTDENLRLATTEEQTYHHHQHLPRSQEDTAMDMELQQQLAFSMENSYNIDINSTTQLVSIDPQHNQQQQQPNWDNQDMTYNNSIHHHQLQEPAADLLNLFHLPRCSASSSSITFANPTPKTINFPSTSLAFLGDVPVGMDSSSSSSVLYDPLLHLNLPPQPPLFKDLFQSLPNGYAFPASASRNGSLFSNGGDMDGEGSGGVYQDGPDGMQFENGVLEFTRDRARMDRGRDGRGTKHFASERHRREQMSDKYQLLKSLVPNPTKVNVHPY